MARFALPPNSLRGIVVLLCYRNVIRALSLCGYGVPVSFFPVFGWVLSPNMTRLGFRFEWAWLLPLIELLGLGIDRDHASITNG